MGEAVHELHQPGHVGPVDVHEPMGAAHHDAVLLEVGVGAVLEAPGLAAQPERDDAQVLAGGMGAQGRACPATGVALVLHAEGAGRVLVACRAGRAGGARTGDVTRVLFGLRLVDGDLEVAPARGAGPLEVPRDGGPPNVVDVAAQPIEPIGCRNGPLAPRNRPEAPAHLGRPCHNRPHEPH